MQVTDFGLAKKLYTASALSLQPLSDELGSLVDAQLSAVGDANTMWGAQFPTVPLEPRSPVLFLRQGVDHMDTRHLKS